MSNEDTQISPGGSPILQHREEKPFAPASGESCLEQIGAHIERHLGPISVVLHEIISDTVHLDVHVVPATDEVPYLRLVTSGMSDLPMAVPEGLDAPRFMELVLTLPPDWPIEYEDFQDGCHYWPLRLLKTLARLPHKQDTWLGIGHTLSNGDPAMPYAPSVGFDSAMLFPQVTASDAFDELTIDANKTIVFMAVMPLYPEEMAFKLERGTEALLDRLDAAGIQDAIDPHRVNVGLL
ncbi:suppressor of fused domain protein [uncultured Xanthomonas sp.]|uniref:suppressor of fused domain protein n=1 Tax=uncultured Xanthomonas sp. TaxID=152831 RepID=UPI0025D8094E|nr:suppressor of fused domain protein [uncultured Xanthomonas sp.]